MEISEKNFSDFPTSDIARHRRWLRSTCFSSSANRLNQSILGLYFLNQPQKPTTDTQHRTRFSAKAINVSGWPIQALPLIFWISATALNDAIAINNLWKYSNLLSNKPKRRNYLVQFGSNVHRGVVVVMTRFRSSSLVVRRWSSSLLSGGISHCSKSWIHISRAVDHIGDGGDEQPTIAGVGIV